MCILRVLVDELNEDRIQHCCLAVGGLHKIELLPQIFVCELSIKSRYSVFENQDDITKENFTILKCIIFFTFLL